MTENITPMQMNVSTLIIERRTEMIERIIENYSKAQSSGAWLPCPRCGKLTMKERLRTNAMSRLRDIYICDKCGNEEAVERMPNHFSADDAENERRKKSIEDWFVCTDIYGHKKHYEKIEHGESVPVEAKVTVWVTKEDVDDAMVAALEGGINYWCGEAEVEGGEYHGEYASDEISEGGTLILHDIENGEKYKFTLDHFLKGLELVIAKESPQGIIDELGRLDTFNIDALAADAIVQYGVFGERVFA